MWVTNRSVGLPVVAFIRKVKTASGATAVQIAEKDGRRNKIIEHVGSAHADSELAALLETARSRLLAGQQMLDLGLDGAAPGPARITGKRARWLIETITTGWRNLGFGVIADEAFFQLVLARLVQPTSMSDTVRVVGELGMTPAHRNTYANALTRCATSDYRDQIATACFAHAASIGGLALVLYDVMIAASPRRRVLPHRPPRFWLRLRIPHRLSAIASVVDLGFSMPWGDRVDDLPVGEHLAVPVEVRRQIGWCFHRAGTDDERQPCRVELGQVRRREHPGGRGDDHAGGLEAMPFLELGDDRHDRGGLGGVAFETADLQREPGAVDQHPDQDLRVHPPFLRGPDLAQAVFLLGLEILCCHVVEHQAQAPGGGGVGEAPARDQVPKLTGTDLGKVALNRLVRHPIRAKVG